MTNTLKINFALIDVPSRFFSEIVSRDAEVQEFLQIISEKTGNTYTALFFDGAEISPNEYIYDYWEPDTIYIASPNSEMIPPDDFLDTLSSNGNNTDTLNSAQYLTTENYDQNFSKNISDKYIFYFTGSTKEHLLNGIPVNLNIKMDKNDCKFALQKALEQNNIYLNNRKLFIFLAGALPFNSGRLEDVYNNEDTKKVIYGVITRNISKNFLEEKMIEFLNIDDQNHQKIISPLFESTNQGLCDMACLISYLVHCGQKTNQLFQSTSRIFQFPPFIISMSKLVDGCQILIKDIVTISSTFSTFLRSALPQSYCKNENVLEHVFQFCSFFMNLKIDQSNRLPNLIHQIDPENPTTFQSEKNKNLYRLGQFSITYFWNGDFSEDFEFEKNDNFSIENLNEIERAFEFNTSFKPISPLSIPYVSDYAFVKGKEHTYLSLMLTKNDDDQNSIEKVKIYNPKSGAIELKEIGEFAREQENNEIDDLSDLTSPDDIEQIIMVNFDESKLNDTENSIPKLAFSSQLLSIFSQLIENSYLGIASFSNDIKLINHLNLSKSNFEEGINKIELQTTSTSLKLWDSIIVSIEEIVNFRKDKTGNDKFKNAKSRILVISSGEDNGSANKVENVVKSLKINNITIDSIILNNSTNDEGKMLCAVCHSTGGFSFKINNIEEGISLFNKQAFLNINSRKNYLLPIHKGDRNTISSRIRIDSITSEFMNKAKEDAIFDTNILDKFIQMSSNIRFLTTKKICSLNENLFIPSKRQRRILREFFYAMQMNDDTIKIFTFKSNIDSWRVFIKGPINSPYENKWWQLKISLPIEYPFKQPQIRFLSIPYHINVSKEGRVCLDCNCNRIIDFIIETKKLLAFPSIENAIDLTIFDTFKNNRSLYDQLARESSNLNAKDNFTDFIQDSHIEDDENFTSVYGFNGQIPPSFGEKIQPKKLCINHRPVKASSGVIYFLDELINILKSDNPVCMVTGRRLTDKIEDFIDSF